jgi:hypothetical protein
MGCYDLPRLKQRWTNFSIEWHNPSPLEWAMYTPRVYARLLVLALLAKEEF